MPISLKEQFKQAVLIKEAIKYNAPLFSAKYYDDASHKNGHSKGQEYGRRMFYDFYAMEFLWSFVGSGTLSKSERDKLASMDPDDPEKAVILSKSYKFLPYPAIKFIDNLYEQVVDKVSENLIYYIKCAVLQEFQYLVEYSGDWQSFRHVIIGQYNSKQTVSKEQFNSYIDQYIPDMKPYPGTIIKLLKFSKYFSKMTSIDNKDSFDIIRNLDKSETPPEVFEPDVEPEKNISDPDSNDDTGVTEPEYGKYGNDVKSPYEFPYSGLTTFKDVPQIEIPGEDEEDPENKEIEKSNLTEEIINPHKIEKVETAMRKSDLTLDDIAIAYNHLRWNGSYGGKRWGEGAISLLKLINSKKTLSLDEMSGIIDHIYDLQHNSGSLLNKGPMNVSDHDLNRRFKITDITRFIPYVSPMIKDVIIRYHKYLGKNRENILKIFDFVKLPVKEFSPEEQKILESKGLKCATDDDSYRIGINFLNKRGQSINGYYYEISKREFEGKDIFIITDNLDSDVKKFDTFEEAFGYLNNFSKDFNSDGSIEKNNKQQKIEKNKYLASHTGMDLDPLKEEELLNLNIAKSWSIGGINYVGFYKNHTEGRIIIYSFANGTFLVTYYNSSVFKIFDDWQSLIVYLKHVSKKLKENPYKKQAQIDIDIKLGKVKPVPDYNPYTPILKQKVSLDTDPDDLPPNPKTSAAYSAHSGIKSPPKSSIRLMEGDETIMATSGFKVGMIGSNVVYVHHGTGDIIKFFPNNTAKLMSAETSLSVTKTITEMLDWITTKYNSGTVTSPFQAQSTFAGYGSTMGIKAGTLFEKSIIDAGFVWDIASHQYFDDEGNILKINPNRSSVLTFKSGVSTANESEKKFSNLAALIKYIKNDFPSQKKK